MRKSKNIETVHVAIDCVNLVILVERISARGPYYAKCGYRYNGHAMVCAGVSRLKNIAIKKCISEFCERVVLISLKGNVDILESQVPLFLRKGNYYSKLEKGIEVASLKDAVKWIIPESIINPKLATTPHMDGTGFAAHIQRNQAIQHAVCEIYERHCIGLFWDTKNTKLVEYTSGLSLDSSTLNFIRANNLATRLFEVVPDKKSRILHCSISMLVDEDGYCYFGSASRSSLETSFNAALFESIMMYRNINEYWKKQKTLNPKIQELFKCYVRSYEYIAYMESRISIKKRFSKRKQKEKNYKIIISNFIQEFSYVYLNDIGKIGDRFVLKVIAPKAYLRKPYGFSISRQSVKSNNNKLPFPFG